MSGIKIHDDNSPMRGAVLYLNKTVAAFLDKNQGRSNEPKFKQLIEMLKNDLYITDLRLPSEDEKYHQFDLVGFAKNGEPLCFTFRANEHLDIHQFKTTAFSKLCEPSQEMVVDIQTHLGFENDNAPDYTL